MIDWSTRRDWLKQEVAGAQTGTIEFAITHNDAPPKRGVAVTARLNSSVGQFYFWESGEADFDIMVGQVFTHNEWGMKLGDRKHVQEAFADFLHKLVNA